MKKSILIILLMSCLTVHAGPKGWVSDKLEIQMRAGPGLQFKILKMLSSGTPLTLLDGNDSGYSHVALESGEEGWILSRYISSQPVARAQMEENTKKLGEMYEENKALKTEVAALKTAKENSEKTSQDLSAEASRLNTEVIAIRQASANALQIQAERDQLQEKVINLERDLDATKREKKALDDSNEQDWFMIGAGVLFGGIVLGLILPRLSWRKRSNWDSF